MTAGELEPDGAGYQVTKSTKAIQDARELGMVGLATDLANCMNRSTEINTVLGRLLVAGLPLQQRLVDDVPPLSECSAMVAALLACLTQLGRECPGG